MRSGSYEIPSFPHGNGGHNPDPRTDTTYSYSLFNMY